MGMKEDLMTDMKAAMRAKDTVKLAVVRQIKGEIGKYETSKVYTGETTDDDVKNIIRSLIKQHVESYEAFEAAGRDDDAAKEKAEMGVLKTYLPAALTGEGLTEKAREVIAEVGAEGPRDMGKVMGKFKALGLEFDGKELSGVVKTLLK
jgi:uncharacterized protein YqeY